MGPGTSVSTTAPVETMDDVRPAPEITHAPAAPQPNAANEETRDRCPVQEAIRIVGRKWHLILLWELSQRAAGFNELKQRARGISAKMLSQSLNDLEREDLVVRHVVTERPLRVMYRLTPKAEELAAVFEVFEGWGRRHGLCQETEPDVTAR